MATKRKPINRPVKRRVTPEAVLAYRRMLDAETDEAYSEADWDLRKALGGMKPWQWPTINPDDEVDEQTCGPGTIAWWRSDEHAELKAALKEAAR